MKRALVSLAALLFATLPASAVEVGSNVKPLSFGKDQTIVDITKVVGSPLEVEGLPKGGEIAVLRGDLAKGEAEALLLEAQLIKRYRPPYNVLLRDDKSFPFILLRMDHAFPRVQKHRGARRAKGRYYGPFASAGSVTKTLNALQKTFLLRSCTDSFFANRSRPCLLYQIKRCSAPCVGRIGTEEYAGLVSDAQDFLEGRSTAVQKRLGDAMTRSAEAMDFEQAAVLRDRLKMENR